VVGDIQSGDSYGSTGRLWARNAFVVGQVAVSIVLLVVSSLLLRSLQRVTTLDPGFDLDRGLVAMVNVDASRYAADGGLPLGERIVEALAGVPGVESSSFAGILALGTDGSATRLQVEGRPQEAGSRTYLNSVGPRYFATLGIPIAAGREFDARDREGSPPVAIVSEAFSSAYFPGESALGQRVRRSEDEPWFEIVGIAQDSKYASVAEAPTPLFYTAYTQRPRVSSQIRPVVVHVRTTGAPAALADEVRRIVTGVDPAVFVEVRTLRDATSAEAGLRRFGTRLFGSIGAVALLLATIGLYGVMAHVVSSRTREIGTRMALGAGSGQILRGVLAQGLRLVAVGVAIGALGSWVLGRALVAALAGLSPADPVAFGGATAVLLIVALAASYFPARRAAGLNPVEALRVD
jgi:predicted permease